MGINFNKVKEQFSDTSRKVMTGVGDGLISVGEWAKENPEAATIAAGLLSFGAKTLSKQRKNSREQYHRDREIYDRSAGMYWDLRRTPTAAQKIEIERRKQNGEKLGEILRSMRLI